MIVNIKGVICNNDESWIYELYGVEHTAPADVLSALQAAEQKKEKVRVCVNSGGGDVMAGVEIYEALRKCATDVIIGITGMAASAASVICCARYCEISPAAQMMIHNVSCCCNGDYKDMDKTSEILRNANLSVAQAYVLKTGKTEAEILKYMDSETWLSSKQAVELGFCDKVSDAETNTVQLVAAFGGILPRAVIEEKQKQKQKLIDELNNMKGAENEQK